MRSQRPRCPTCCDSGDVRRSHKRLRDLPVLLVGMRPYRCMSCYKRFYGWKRRPKRAPVELGAG